jgi:hypothetical protein
MKKRTIASVICVMRMPIAVIISGSPVYHALGVVCGRPQSFDVTVDVLAVVADFKRGYCKACPARNPKG